MDAITTQRIDFVETRKSVLARFTFEGVHCWPDAPEAVRFLRDPHRHVFYVEMIKSVQHTDREVEFIMLAWRGKKLLQETFAEFNEGDKQLLELKQTSCEQLAVFLLTHLELQCCAVYEDNENGAIVQL